MMSEGGGETGCPSARQVWLPLPHSDDDDEEEEEEGARGEGTDVGGGGEVVVVGSGGATTLYSREDGATVLEAADGTTTVLRPHGSAHRLTVTVEGGDGAASEGMTAIVDEQTGTATLVEGAEVVRTQAVSYATPILHHVFLQAAPTTHQSPASTTTTATLRRTPAVTAAILQATPSHGKEEDGRSNNNNNSGSSGRSSSTSTITTSTSKSSSSSSSSVSSSGSKNIKSENTTSNSRVAEETATMTAATTTTTITTTTTTTSTCLPTDHQHHTTTTTAKHNHPRHPSLSSSPSSTPPPSLSPPSASSGPRTDDELTSLSWLQDSNLLRGTALSPVKTAPGSRGQSGAGEVVKAESPTSDYGEESSDALEPGELTLNDQPHTQPSRQQPIPYNPQVHVNAKPPYSFSCLIFMAIEDSNSKALPVKDIYAWILDHFPYFRNAPTGWKNSVRHNLSLNKCFRKVEKAPTSLQNLGKGSLWMVDPAYRPNLLQALSKTPFHPYSNLDRIYLVSTKSAYNRQQAGEAASGQAVVGRASVAVESPAASPSKPVGANVPDPELFPYLARRLGSSGLGLEVVGAGVHSEDVDAAAAMLALKHGSRIVTPASVISDSYSQLRDGRDTSVLYEENRKRKRKRKHTEVGDARMMVISSSPSQDHSYTSVDGEEEYPGPTALPPPCRTPHTTPHPHPPPPKKANHSPTSSIDEAFSEDSYDSDVTSEASQADMRQLVEGADALLNLAAVATSLASQRHLGEAVASPSPPHSSPSVSHHSAPRLHHSAAPHLGRVHILKPSAAKSASGKHSKAKCEVAHNNNTILTNNNKVLKVKRFSSRASSRQ